MNRDAVLDEYSGGPTKHVLHGVQIPQGEGAILEGCTSHSKPLAVLAAAVAVVFSATGIIQLPISSRSRRDLSVCQAGANSILKISGCRVKVLHPTRHQIGHFGDIRYITRSRLHFVHGFAVGCYQYSTAVKY